jgi:uncharacterized HhH-GPD family protein
MAAKLRLAQDPAADDLLSKEPLALLIGMVLDQQIPLERAFMGPLELKERLGGGLDVEKIAEMDPDELASVFARPMAIHRFPASNAKRVQRLCQVLLEQYEGRPEHVWESAEDGEQLLANVKALPGFGEQKARIFVALLGKQLGVRPPGWEEAAGDYGTPDTYMSVADIVGPESLAKVRAHKKERKAAASMQAPGREGSSPGRSAQPAKKARKPDRPRTGGS